MNDANGGPVRDRRRCRKDIHLRNTHYGKHTMTKPFVHAGRTYTFERHRGCVKPIRDDGTTLWSTYPTLPVGEYHAHLPAFATITEAQAAIMGQSQPTYIHMPVWAHSADEAARLRKEMSNVP